MRCKTNTRSRKLENLRFNDVTPFILSNMCHDANNVNWLGKSWSETK